MGETQIGSDFGMETAKGPQTSLSKHQLPQVMPDAPSCSCPYVQAQGFRTARGAGGCLGAEKKLERMFLLGVLAPLWSQN